MLRKTFLAASVCCVASTAAFADFSYDQNSKITGGAMAGMMKMAGAFSKAARDPMNSTVMVKGDRMAHIGTNHISIIDLKSETITDIDPAKKTYSVITFADMAKAMQQMQEKMAEKSKEQKTDINMNFKASVKETGEKKVVAGFNTKEVVLTIVMEGTDQKSGNKGGMTVVSDMWLAPKIPGYEEVHDFYKRMSTKLAWTPGSNGMAMQRGDMMKGMSELQKESAKLEGVPVLQIMKMGGVGDGSAPPQSGGNVEQPKPAAPAGPSASELAASAIAGRFGLGGLGKKKKPAEDQPAQTSSAPAQSSDSLMEMTTESSNFSTAPVDPSRFEVPAGFKKVENPMEKALR